MKKIYEDAEILVTKFEVESIMDDGGDIDMGASNPI